MADKIIMDVSRWQGRIDWDAVKRSGKIDGVMLRAMGNSGAGKASKPYLEKGSSSLEVVSESNNKPYSAKTKPLPL